MEKHILKLIFLIIYFTILYGLRYQKFVEYERAAKNESREIFVKNTLQNAAGVYLNKRNNGLNKTVMITVAAFNEVGNSYYKVYFKNFMCFVKHYNYDMVVYILHHDIPHLDTEIDSIKKLGARVLTYPDELFWNIVATKKTHINKGKGFADYAGKVPSFHSYGALVMLVPALEVMMFGYNVIYFDVDMGLVQNPVPYLTTGDADFVTTLEIRRCPEKYPSSMPQAINWEAIEPNTGVMHLRATSQGIAFFRAWLERIVHNNAINDQKMWDRKVLGATFTANCNWNQSDIPAKRKNPDSATYCFLSEILFQNGLIGIQCSTKVHYKDSWVLEMNKHAISTSALHYAEVDKNLNSSGKFPVIVHANYCNGKSHELAVRGLWLLGDNYTDTDSSQCQSFRLDHTHYNIFNWPLEVQQINHKRAYMYDTFINNGSLVQGSNSLAVYAIDSNRRYMNYAVRKRAIPDKETFEALFGENYQLIKKIPGDVLDMVVEDLPFPSVKLLHTLTMIPP